MSHPQALEAFRLLYQDEQLLVALKPSGWAVHPGWAPKERSMLGPLRDQVGRYLYPAHRLDRGTSGAVLFSFDKVTARSMAERFAKQQVHKRYLALVRGHPSTSEGFVDHAIPRSKGGPRVAAQTAWRCLHKLDSEPRESSLIATAPLTGRMHQIRKHLAHLNHPIIGDSAHGRPRLNQAFRKRYALKRLALHAWAMGFEHPVTEQRLELIAPLPESLARPLGHLGFAVNELPDPWSLLFPQHQEAGSTTPLD